MTELDETALRSIPEHERNETALRVADETFDILFDRAPVMMHAVDKEYNIVKVNQRWLQTLEYKRDEVLGRKNTDFITDESRLVAINDVLPLLRRAGSLRSVGFEFVKKKGRAIDVLLDAEVSPVPIGRVFAYAILRETRDAKQWHQASIFMKAFMDLTNAQAKLGGILLDKEGVNQDPGPIAPQALSGDASAKAGETRGTFLEHTENISVNLRAILRVHEEWLDASAEQQRELLGVAKSIEKSLAYLADTAADRQKSE